ncbi:antitoxin YefM [Enterococcus sp. PF1-24]|uniref:type II toxin-antitoxin system Phd/YefM family antitoxin n=1 Tax=unclassified Enterococcus TaxID=2608891 RepID=UPI0024739337|nr:MULTISPECIES: type II toxin-antitoxin system Phd/YefM family antitoxin [unclassified Enterococcus]MDH6364322.1 antitoxin YefM [Enterococcus sp. PFB1-1]MDH6401489.1 antitoxin YefM [Enterococcus sp. PF1-24]
MLATNYSNFRENMKKYLDEVTNDFTSIIITRKNDENVVILSEKEYQNLIENQYVLGNKKNKSWLDESKRQLEQEKK